MQRALEEATKIQENLDRKVFFLKTLFETSRDLGSVIQPIRIMETFLMMTMGPLGITHGMAAFFNVRTREGHVASRGFTNSEGDRLKENLAQIFDRCFSEKSPTGAGTPPRIRIISSEHSMDHSLFPPQLRVLILWKMSEEYSGLLSFGDKIAGQPLDEEDLDILLNFTNTLIGSLSNAIATRNIEQLNSDLQKKNIELQEALEEASSIRRDLDKRIFHLKTLSDLNAELSPLIRTDALLDNFLLVNMGALGIRGGFAILLNRDTGTVRAASRGMDIPKEADAEGAERLLYRCFEASEEKSLAPMTVTRIMNTALFNAAGMTPEVNTALLFVVDQSLMGIVGFSATISDLPLSREDEELLMAQATAFMVFLKNARSFEIIQALNEDLRQRNEELKQTIAELTEARHKIAILEKAKAHVRSLIQHEKERIGRVSLLDFALVFLLATVVGLLFNFSNPQGVALLPDSLFRPHPPFVDVTEAGKLVDDGAAIVVDARPREFYEEKHIEGAINVPPALFDIIYMMRLSRVEHDREIIVYGRNVSRLYDEEVAYRLKQRDHENVRLLSGGLRAWEKEGYPVGP